VATENNFAQQYQPPPEIPDEALLTAEQLAAALTAHGFKMSAKTLATKVSRPGPTGAPPYTKFGPWRRYQWKACREWARASLTQPGRGAHGLRHSNPNSSI
jgi:hypothetical protein